MVTIEPAKQRYMLVRQAPVYLRRRHYGFGDAPLGIDIPILTDLINNVEKLGQTVKLVSFGVLALAGALVVFKIGDLLTE